jgi:hypothetical protein
MNKERVFEDFFRSLNTALKNASIYFEEHPVFIKSVREVKKHTDTLLDFVSPLNISFTSNSLVAEGIYFEKDKIFEELAHIFHFRKIQSIQVRKGITFEELIIFLTKIHLLPEIIQKEGGLSNVLKVEKISHLAVEELDYSQLLKGEGDEVENVWLYLMKDAVEQENLQKIIKFADDFGGFLQDLNTEDLVENDELKVNIDKLFTRLKSLEEDKYRKCSKELLKSIIKDNKIAQETEFEDLRGLFKDLSDDDFATVLWEEISTDDSFNPLSLQIFSQLTQKRDQESIAESFEKISQNQRSLSRSPQMRNKIKELLTGSSDAVISESYQKTLTSILRDISYEGELTFDHDLLQENYRFMLIYFLNKEKDTERAISILDEILSEWESIVNQKNLEFLKYFVTVLDKKRNDLSYDPIFMKANKQILYFIAEYRVMQEDIPSDFNDVTNYLKETYLGINAFLDKMFKENKVGPVVLQLFFQIYSESYYLFKKNLMKRSSDIDFLEEMTKNLGKVDSPASLESLKCIFSFCNESMKIKVLESIEKLYIQDEDFLFDILKMRGAPLKRITLKILMRNEHTKKRVIEELFSVLSPFGIKNRILLENIEIIQDMDLEKARDRLMALSEGKFFWNKKLRRETTRVLEEWDAGQY